MRDKPSGAQGEEQGFGASADNVSQLYVRMEKYDARILERIEAVSVQYEDQLAQVSGYLLVTTDFRRPRRNHGV